MMTMKRRYCCSTSRGEDHDSDCPSMQDCGAEATSISVLVETWSKAETEAALHFLCGYTPQGIRAAHEHIERTLRNPRAS